MKIKTKTIKQRFCESIAENFVVTFEESKINPNKQIFFIVPTQKPEIIQKYKQFFLDSYKLEILDDDFFSIHYDNISLLLNVYKMIAQKILHLSKETDTCFTFLILKFDIMRKLIGKLQSNGFKCSIVDATKNQDLINKFRRLNNVTIIEV